jgi:hypothetical protein
MHTRKQVQWVLVVLLSLAMVAGCSSKDGGSGEKKKADAKKGDDQPVVNDKDGGKGGIEQAKPDFALTSKRLADTYSKDREAAKAKYKDKVIELTGVVMGVTSTSLDGAYLVLEGTKKDPLVTGIICYTRDKHPWRKATPGQLVKLKGKDYQFSPDPALAECVILEVSGTRAPLLTAEKLAKEYAANPDATSKKYKDKWLILSGEIDKVTFNEARFARVALKTPGKLSVFCGFFSTEEPQTKNLKADQKVKILGAYSLGILGEGDVGLQFCILYDEPT